MPRVKFVRNPAPHEGGSEFRIGTVTEMTPISADRWIRRGAVEVVDDTKPAKASVTKASGKAASTKETDE